MAKETRGRPITVDTPETRQKIEEATALDASIEEVCFYANISRESYYQLIKKDKEFSDRLEALRNNPILKARKTITDKLNEPEHAKWYLERKAKREFSSRNELTGADGKAIEVKTITGMKIIKENGTSIQDKK